MNISCEDAMAWGQIGVVTLCQRVPVHNKTPRYSVLDRRPVWWAKEMGLGLDSKEYMN